MSGRYTFRVRIRKGFKRCSDLVKAGASSSGHASAEGRGHGQDNPGRASRSIAYGACQGLALKDRCCSCNSGGTTATAAIVIPATNGRSRIVWAKMVAWGVNASPEHLKGSVENRESAVGAGEDGN